MIGRLKALRNKKGFTLVELMIVVAVIGILAIVLLPKIGTLKTTAKSAGLDTNMRMVQAVVQSKISDYAGKGGTTINNVSAENTLASDIVNTLSNGDKIVDPFNNAWTGATLLLDSSAIPNGTEVAVAIGTTAGQVPPALAANPNANASGMVYVSVYDSANKDIVVKLTPYDVNGTPLTNKAVTINP